MKTITLAAAVVAALQAPDDTQRVIAKLDTYMAAYEPRLSELVADERMDQTVRLSARNLSSRRVLISEVAFIALKDAGWLGFRHVKSVNNRGVRNNRRSLESTLMMPSMDAARALLRASAAHNLGHPRTTNLPNLPLEFLHVRNRHRMAIRADGRVMVRGVETARIVFEEKITPTLIKNPSTDADMPADITAWIDDDGRLLRAEVVTFTAERKLPYEHLVRVDFAESTALGGLLVPNEMYEEFPVQYPHTGTAIATYSNFRKFQTSARIVPQ
jgi:hypothetical protein